MEEKELPPRANTGNTDTPILCHGSLEETMSSLSEGQQCLSQTLEWMLEHLQHHLAPEIAEIIHAKISASPSSPVTPRNLRPRPAPVRLNMGPPGRFSGRTRQATARPCVSHAEASYGDVEEPEEFELLKVESFQRMSTGERSKESRKSTDIGSHSISTLGTQSGCMGRGLYGGRPKRQVSHSQPRPSSFASPSPRGSPSPRCSALLVAAPREVSDGPPRRQISAPARRPRPRRSVDEKPRRQISPSYSIKPRFSTNMSVVQEQHDLRVASAQVDDSVPTVVHIMDSSKSSDGGKVSVVRSTSLAYSYSRSSTKVELASLVKGAPKNCVSRQCQRVALNPNFQVGCAVMIMVNIMILGYSVEHAVDHDEDEAWVRGANQFCALFFCLELAVRVVAFGTGFWCGDEWRWNVFDSTLVLQSIVDFVLETISAGQDFRDISWVKTLKILRIMRIIRLFRFFRALSLMVLMVAHSLKALSWVLLLLLLMMYTFAIYFTQICTDSIKADPDASHVGIAKIQFGSLAKTMYSLILSILSGVSWGEICNTLISIGWAPTALFLFYISFSTLAVLNIITGVFVENAVEVAKNRKDVMIEKADAQRQETVEELRSLFWHMDDDESGSLSKPEMKVAWSDSRIRGCFTSLGLDLHDMERLYFLIDEESTGEVMIDDFLGGCLKLRGEARSIDVHTVLRETKKLHWRLEDQEARLEDAIFCLGSEAGIVDALKKQTEIIVGRMAMNSKQTGEVVTKLGQRIKSVQGKNELSGAHGNSHQPAQEKGHGWTMAEASFPREPSTILDKIGSTDVGARPLREDPGGVTSM